MIVNKFLEMFFLYTILWKISKKNVKGCVGKNEVVTPLFCLIFTMILTTEISAVLIVSSDILNYIQEKIQQTNINVAYSIFPRLNDGLTTIFPWQPETPSTPPAVVMPPLYNLPIPNESMSAKRIRFLMLKKGQLLFSHDQL